MAQETFRLRRIIVIDSFWKGKVNEINFDGHTQLEGTNGAGKTSLMRLLPLFYGMRPGDIVSKVDQAKNFVDYYLPRESSLLVYEYQRVDQYQQQICCMVASSSGGRTIQYKLIDAPYQQDCFIGRDHRPFKVSEVERNYGRNVYKSNYLNVAQYRQVIQNLREGRTSAAIRELQRRFAFSQVPMPHVDKVVNGTIEKNLDFDAVKRMLVAITADYLARGQGGDHREPMQLNKDEIGSWLSDIQASREVHAISDKITRWQGEFSELEQHLAQLRHLLALLNREQTSLSGQQTEQEHAIKALRDSLKALEKAYRDEREQLQLRLTDARDQLMAKQAQCDRLDDQKADFDADDAASYQLKADEKSRFNAELQDVEQLLSSLEGDVAKVADKYRELLHKLELELSNERAKLNGQMSEVRDAAAARLTTINDNYQQKRRKLEQEQDGILLDLKEQLLTEQHQLKINSDARANPQADIEQETALQLCRQQLADAQSGRNQHLLALSQLTEQLGKAERERDHLLTRQSNESKRRNELQSAHDTLLLQLNPKAGSLQQFLDDSEIADWKQTIGSLLSPQLLSRTDLSPEWLGDGLQSLYGVKLDLAPLQHNNPLARNEAQLREQLAELEAQIQQHAELESQLAQLLKEQEKTIAAVRQQHSGAQAQEKRFAGQIDQLQQQLERQLRLRDDSVKRKLVELDSEAEALRKRIAQLTQQQQTQTELAQEQQHELHNLSLEARADVETDRDSQLDTLKAQLETLESRSSERRSDYKRQQKQALDKVDPDGEIDRCHQLRKQLNAKLVACSEYQQKANDYRFFMTQQYHLRDELGQQLMELQQQVTSLENGQSKLKSDYDSGSNKQRGDLDKAKEKLQRIEDLLAHLSRAAAACEALELTPAQDPQLPDYQAALLADFVKQNHDKFSALEKSLNREISAFASTLRSKHSKSSLYESWVKLVADNDHYQGSEAVLKYRDPIGDLLAGAGQLKASTSLQIQTNSAMINEFYQHLENFDRRIKNVGRKLSERVTKLAQFEAFAEISVGTVTKLDQLEYWSPLKRFSECYEMAKDQLQDINEEIPDDLIAAMQSLARVLPSEGVLLEHNDLFDLEFVITEKGQVKRARNARQLKKVSSTGLSYLAMLSLFAGLLAMLRGDSNDGHKRASTIILPVDELGELAAENIKLLLTMFDDNAIQILSASPATDRQVLALYKNHYKLKDSKIYQAHVPMSKLEQLMAARAAKPSVTTDATEAASHV
ncbi:ATP-binding protein [Ferrimonas senticii]|uniref:ATP-binding protein n=1 Tax=Ferrimonas senticii TaxID=394566 RepID=UPI00041A3BE4|nr:ATP-binding protein [Ferrimonas senticii]